MIKTNLLLIIFFFIFSSCQGMRETLSMKKKENVDEFLVEKKNPLVLPPEFTELPIPKNSENQPKKKEKNIDLSKILNKSDDKKNINVSNDLEKSISDILNKK